METINLSNRYYPGRSRTSSVWFRRLNDKGDTVGYEEYGAACFSGITYRSLDKNVHALELFIRKENCPYNEEDVIKWIDLVNSWGFPVEYTGIKNDAFYFGIIIKMNEDKQIFKTKLHLNSTLFLVRYLWESGFNVIPDFTFSLIEKFPQVDAFYLMQFAHHLIKMNGLYGNTNHTLREFHLQTFVSKELIEKKIEKSVSIYSGSSEAMTSSWSGTKLEKDSEYDPYASYSSRNRGAKPIYFKDFKTIDEQLQYILKQSEI